MMPALRSMWHYAEARAYSENLRENIVDGVTQRGMNECQAARIFRVKLPQLRAVFTTTEQVTGSMS